MPRTLVAMLISILAVAFAFGALTAIRWPSIIMVLGWVNEGSAAQAAAALDGVDWRQLGLIYGGPYFLASLCFYAASAMIAQRRHGGVLWYLMGCTAGFPSIYLVDFEPGWWRDPSIGEGVLAGAGVIALLLAVAVWDLRKRLPRAAQTDKGPAAAVAATGPAPVTKPKPARRPGPTSAAILRNRALFAAEGRKMLARQKRSLRRS